MTPYQEFIYKRSYSRWIPEKGRRENWDETVDRYRAFFQPRVPEALAVWFDGAIHAVRRMDVMPSMRCLWSAGPALANDHIAGYNCAYTAIDSVKTFSEILYILMNGAGVGFSTERQYINLLPAVPSSIVPSDVEWVIEDSKLGWAQGYHELLEYLYQGRVLNMSLRSIRPKGAPLKTFGGRASGPEPLLQLIKFTVKTFKNAAGRKLNSLEVYDLVCMIANCVVSGGVRRSSTINLSNLTDIRMRDAKVGQFYLEHPQRMLSNNSVVYTEKPDMGIFTEEWLHLMRSGSGERGIINRESLQGSAEHTGRDADHAYGTNPCGEIILRNKQFCNLTEVIVRPDDHYLSLRRKISYAVLLGTLQSGLTTFKYLSPSWKANCEEERLLGVSLTGLMDNLSIWGYLNELRGAAWSDAKELSEAMDTPCPKAITCVKPSGTVSQLVGCASGIHPRHSPFYIRRVRVSSTDPVAHLLVAQGVNYHPETGQDAENANTLVFDFPQAAPEFSVFRGLPALDQLTRWLKVKQDWCDHNPSCTIYVREHEWLEVGAWIYKYWDWVGGLSFLPYDGGVYELAPYEEITEEEYKALESKEKKIDWESLSIYEHNDFTEGAKTYACTGDKCEIF